MNSHPSSTQSFTDDRLQPLREVGSLEKTRFWDSEEITEALRIANLRGIRLDSLYAPKESAHQSRHHAEVVRNPGA